MWMQRIRCVGLLAEDGKILLVRHRHVSRDISWLMPPGGALAGTETVLEAAVREVREETGLWTRPRKIAYLRQFLDGERGYHNLEIYVWVERTGGQLRVGRDPEEAVQYICDAGFFSRKDLEETPLTVHPAILRRERFWADLAAGFSPGPTYLGISSVEEEGKR